MARVFTTVALAVAGVIAGVSAFSWLTDQRIAEPRTNPIAPSEKQFRQSQALGSGAAQNERRAEKTQPSPPRSNTSEIPTNGRTQLATPARLDSTSVRRSADAEEARAADASSLATTSRADEPPVAVQVALSAAEVHDFFVEGDACLVLGDDAKGKDRCNRAQALAELIVTAPKAFTDSWAYGMEYELDRRLAELTDDQHSIKRKAVQCNAAGCIVYVEGARGWPNRFARLLSLIRSDSDIAQLNDNGKWPRPGPWAHGVNDRSMVVLPR